MNLFTLTEVHYFLDIAETDGVEVARKKAREIAETRRKLAEWDQNIEALLKQSKWADPKYSKS